RQGAQHDGQQAPGAGPLLEGVDPGPGVGVEPGTGGGIGGAQEQAVLGHGGTRFTGGAAGMDDGGQVPRRGGELGALSGAGAPHQVTSAGGAGMGRGNTPQTPEGEQ